MTLPLIFRPLLGAALLAFVPAVAVAQTATSPAPVANEATDHENKGGNSRLAACRADVATLCPAAKGAKRRECLTSNQAKLSPACATAFADVEAKAKAMREACAEDVKAHCAEAGKSKGKGIVQCLRANATKVSAACNAALTARFSK
ncbi:MAG: hypothetical protein AB7E81_07035 [Hyphomicrobiaceae bacterium]